MNGLKLWLNLYIYHNTWSETVAGSLYPPQHIHAISPECEQAFVNLMYLGYINKASLYLKTPPMS